MIFHRTTMGTDVYLGITNTQNADNNVSINSYKNRVLDAIRGNFPGSEWKEDGGVGGVPCLKNHNAYSVATATNIPTEKSEKFISQTIEKLLDGIIPQKPGKEYTIILLATPVQDVEERKLRLAQFYSGFAPYAAWQTSFTYTESDSINSSATFGVNAGVSAGVQHGQTSGVTNTTGLTDSVNATEGTSTGASVTESTGTSETATSGITTGSSSTQGTSSGTTATSGSSESVSNATEESTTGGISYIFNATTGVSSSETTSAGTFVSNAISAATSSSATESLASTVTSAIGTTASKAVASSIAQTVSNTLGRAVTSSVANTLGAYKGVNLGGNFGANFARSSNVTATVGKNEQISQSFTNYNIKHTLELLDAQMKRLDQSTALGMWDFAAYILSEDPDVANNVAHSYLALTQGEQSYLSHSAVNLWRGDLGENSKAAREICAYLRQLRHPLFGLSPAITTLDATMNVYPSVVTATTSLSGKELAYSLNFPRKSVAGLPVISCAEFGRNIVTYQDSMGAEIHLGNIFHMNHAEPTLVALGRQSLASHAFVTGSTGAGKSNAIYQLLDQVNQKGATFLVVEPAKGEYKSVFGNEDDVSVYGTNPALTPLLRLNPFSFADGIHVLEHIDRLVEIFNVCWPMYAAMPAVLKNAVEKSYQDCGWDMMKSVNNYGEQIFPTFADVTRNIKTIIESSEYDTENKGAYKGALMTRLQSLSNGINGMIFSSNEISAAELFDRNVIVDLSRVGSTETKSLIMGILVIKLQEYRMSTANGLNAPLQHVTVLEEAHNLLRRTSTSQSPESANLAGKSVELLANAIAEMRTYGEGFIIADQAPGLLDMSVIRNTNTKIVLRLPEQSDRELVGGAANLNESQIKELAKLPCGVAAVYQNEWIQPVLCKVAYYPAKKEAYQHEPEDWKALDFTEAVSDSLLHCIMDKGLYRKGNKTDFQKLKHAVIVSRLDATVKIDFLDYLNAKREDDIEELRVLAYDFLSAEEVIRNTKYHDDIIDWTQRVVKEIRPSLQGFTNRQINLMVGLLLHEHAEREAEYRLLLNQFTEVYRSKGGVL